MADNLKEGLYLRFLRLFSDNKYKHVYAGIGKFRINFEIADDQYKKAKGLMYRKSMRRDKGMLFIFAKERRYSFWMLNMRFCMDIIWLDGRMRVVDITRNAEPAKSFLSARSYRPIKPAKYVIEVAAGLSKASGVKAGDIIRLPGIWPE